MSGRRANTYLGPIDHPEALGEGDGSMPDETFPNFVAIAKGYGVQAKQVRSKAEYPKALAEMLASKEPYLLDVICPYQEHVLPMIPSGRTVREIIIE
jgi:acetolactate synthase-1/2/3 large subunit